MPKIPTKIEINAGLDGLRRCADWIRIEQSAEVQKNIDESTASVMQIRFPISHDFKAGYELGLETARAILAQNHPLYSKGIDPRDLL